MDNSFFLPSGGVKKRSGMKLVAEYGGPIERLEAVSNGKWHFIRVHLKDGTIEHINSDGPMVF